MSPNIFHYTDINEWIADCLSAKREQNPRYSYRWWSRRLELKSHTLVSLIAAGKRTPTATFLQNFARVNQLTDLETEFALCLADLKRTKNGYQQTMINNHLNNLRSARVTPLTVVIDTIGEVMKFTIKKTINAPAEKSGISLLTPRDTLRGTLPSIKLKATSLKAAE